MDQPNVTETERLQRLYSRRVAERGVAGGAGCVSPEAILAVIRREGSEEERLATLDHVMSCAACHREYEWLAAVDQAATEAGGGAASRRGPWWRSTPLALAASLTAAVAAGLLVRDQIRRAGEPVRGGTGDIELVAPAAATTAARELAFVWRPVPGATGYVLEVQRGDGAVAHADTTGDTVLVLPDPAGVLPDAEYRWWVRELTDGSEPRSSDFRTLRLADR
ncbi:MAG TPA: hypothetical protein VFZ26_16775 [Gemmatimonadales bacterium]